VDYSDPFSRRRCQSLGNPTGRQFIQILSPAGAANRLGIPRTAVRRLFRSFLRRRCQSVGNPRTAARGNSDPFYRRRRQKAGNPTDGSPGIFQILSTAGADKRLGIPRTAVRGFFRSFLPQAPLICWESHGRQSVDYSDRFYRRRCQSVGNPTDGSPWIIQILSTSARKDLNNPPTAVGGIQEETRSRCRKDLNNPPTAVGGISGKKPFPLVEGI